MRYLYNILLYLAMPWVVLRLLWRSRRDARYRQRWLERFGYVRPMHDTQTLWIHAVSLGESIAAAPLIKALQQSLPGYTLVITTTTPTGSAQILKQYGNQVYHCYFPYDFPHVVSRFLKRIRPQQAIIMETELWPNVLRQLQRRDIPTLIVNARLSPQSFQQYSRFRAFFSEVLAHTTISAQSAADGKRFQQLGVKSERIIVTGNIKFDNPVAESLLTQAKQMIQQWQDRPVWIAGSTHEGEETAVLGAHKKICERYPDALLILVPRHPERFDHVAELCKAAGLRIARRSQQQRPEPQTAVYLGDTTGELMLLYAASQIAFVGGSLVPIGGHNLIEPASLSLPILSGPQLHNFIAVRDLLLDADALLIVEDESALAQRVMELFADADKRHRYGARALSISEGNRGAVQKNLDCIVQCITDKVYNG